MLAAVRERRSLTERTPRRCPAATENVHAGDAPREGRVPASPQVPPRCRRRNHFGHQTKRWSPKMRTYIYGARNGIHIIDLDQTARLFARAYQFVQETAARGGHTPHHRHQAPGAGESSRGSPPRCGAYFVHQPLARRHPELNFRTIKQGLERMKQLERMKDDGTYLQLPKKEVSRLEKEREALREVPRRPQEHGLAAPRGLHHRPRDGDDRRPGSP